MKDRLVPRSCAKTEPKAPRLGMQRQGGTMLGLRAFEKISAVEGIRLSDAMRSDLRSLDDRHIDAIERSRFITQKYGKIR